MNFNISNFQVINSRMDRWRWIFNALMVDGSQNVKVYCSFLIANVIIQLFPSFNLMIKCCFLFMLSATCDPPCTNGGNCLSYNVCQCSKDFRGPQCQWGTERCATTKMKFNGGFSCSGTADVLSCRISCPKNVKFEFQPADVYTCSYATGEFSPSQVPRCVFGKFWKFSIQKLLILNGIDSSRHASRPIEANLIVQSNKWNFGQEKWWKENCGRRGWWWRRRNRRNPNHY